MSVRRNLTALALAALAAATLSACNDQAASSPASSAGSTAPAGGGDTGSASPDAPAVTITTNATGRKVPVDKVVTVSADGGTLSSVSLTSGQGDVIKGEIGSDGTWTASSLLEPGTKYVVKSVATDDEGTEQTTRSRFHTVDLTLAQQTYPSVAPLQGETVGVGMPVIVTFDVAVKDKASIQKHLKVTSTPAQAGTWHWISDKEVHFRPKHYWKAGTDITVDADVNSVPAGNGIYGQKSRTVSFHVGSANVYKVNTQTHQMKVFSDGKLLRTIPITTGKPGFTTRSGTKVIIEKFASKRMNSETIGIDPNSADGYDLDNVQWAMRLTYSGEFIHAAPWSVGSQGYANVSHGCTGMSTANAKWLYDMTKRGDVVTYVGTDYPMTLTNGYGDWNEPYATYAKGSAL